jgi:hypothetical protein
MRIKTKMLGCALRLALSRGWGKGFGKAQTRFTPDASALTPHDLIRPSSLFFFTVHGSRMTVHHLRSGLTPVNALV